MDNFGTLISPAGCASSGKLFMHWNFLIHWVRWIHGPDFACAHGFWISTSISCCVMFWPIGRFSDWNKPTSFAMTFFSVPQITTVQNLPVPRFVDFCCICGCVSHEIWVSPRTWRRKKAERKRHRSRGGFQNHGGSPKNHPFSWWTFSFNQLAIEDPHENGNHQMNQMYFVFQILWTIVVSYTWCHVCGQHKSSGFCRWVAASVSVTTQPGCWNSVEKIMFFRVNICLIWANWFQRIVSVQPLIPRLAGQGQVGKVAVADSGTFFCLGLGLKRGLFPSPFLEPEIKLWIWGSVST